MELEDIVCSLDLAKKLKELGVEQQSIFYYGSFENPLYGVFSESDVEDDLWRVFIDLDKDYGWDFRISAFTAEELGRMLPNVITYKNPYVLDRFDDFRIHTTKFISVNEDMGPCNNFVVYYEASSGVVDDDILHAIKAFNNMYDPKLANAYAKTLILLIEKELVVKEENK